MTVAQFVSPVQQFMDMNGNPLAGAKVYFFQAGTSTPKAAYQDSAGVTPHTHPAIADGSGRLLAYLTEGEAYKVDVFTALDVHAGTPWPVDQVTAYGLNPNTVTDYATGDLLTNTAAQTWPDGVTTSFQWHWPVPPHWVPGSTVTFKCLRRSAQSGTTAKYTYALTRKRTGLTVVTISSGVLDFVPSVVDTSIEVSLGFTMALVAVGDLLGVNLTRLGGDGADNMTVGVSYDGHRFEYTRYASR